MKSSPFFFDHWLSISFFKSLPYLLRILTISVFLLPDFLKKKITTFKNPIIAKQIKNIYHKLTQKSPVISEIYLSKDFLANAGMMHPGNVHWFLNMWQKHSNSDNPILEIDPLWIIDQKYNQSFL